MDLNIIDIVIFIAFMGFVVGFSLFKGRKKESGEDYFLAGRGLSWGIIGISLIAANISSEQLVGMSGSAAGNVGLAIASYEWMPAIVLVLVALFFLPKFLKSGIFTMPQFLEYRYNAAARGIMAFYTMVVYVGVTISAVLYSGALALNKIFDVNLVVAVIFIGIVAAVYTTYGGLKSVAWADIFQGSALIIGGLSVTVIGIYAVGGLDSFFEANEDRLHMILPADHPELPWTALMFGLWIPNFYYWGLNQYITQRTLAAKNLKQGQLGVIFAAGIKLIMPLITVVPGLIALQLYQDQIAINQDAAYPLLIKNLIPTGLKGFVFAAICGAIISSLASMLNSASTIFTLDLYKKHINTKAEPHTIVRMGRIMTIVFVIIGCIIAPQLGNPKFKGIFHFIQDFQGYISPGILAAFLFGLFVKRTPAASGVTALLLNVPVYGLLHLSYFDHIGFLNKMAITFVFLIVVMTIMTIVNPLKEPKILPENTDICTKPAKSVVWLGGIIITITVSLYVVFW